MIFIIIWRVNAVSSWVGSDRQSSNYNIKLTNMFSIKLWLCLSVQKWDATLCQMDSDVDGKTNGEELGDPDCTWTPGAQPSVTTGITHPSKGLYNSWFILISFSLIAIRIRCFFLVCLFVDVLLKETTVNLMRLMPDNPLITSLIHVLCW